MTEDIINKAFDLISQAFQKLSEGAQYGYNIYVKQQVTNGIIGLLISVLILGLIIIVTCKFIKSIKVKKAASQYYKFFDDESEGMCIATVLIIIICIIIGTFMVFMFADSLKQLINPEYYAIQEILSTVTGK
jgi:formate hydrogenlyase subunit 3/multisubunit Na+/H+ antiporter MnhD subunit